MRRAIACLLLALSSAAAEPDPRIGIWCSPELPYAVEISARGLEIRRLTYSWLCELEPPLQESRSRYQLDCRHSTTGDSFGDRADIRGLARDRLAFALSGWETPAVMTLCPS